MAQHTVLPKRRVGRPRKRVLIHPGGVPQRPGPPKLVRHPQQTPEPDSEADDGDASYEDLRKAGVNLQALSLASDAYHADIAVLERLQSAEDRKKYYVGKTDAEVKGTRKCIEVVKTHELPFYLDRLKQDLLSKRTCLGDAVEQTWYGPATDSPKDIRARQFTLDWRDDFSEANRFLARSGTESHIVYRAEFHCAGSHNVCGNDPKPATSLGLGGDGLEHVELSEDEELWDEVKHAKPAGPQGDGNQGADPVDEESATKPAGRRTNCTGSSTTCVQYHFEVMSNDLNKCLVWQIGDHLPVDTRKQKLAPSRFLRNIVLSYAKTIGASAKTIYREVVLPHKNTCPRFPFPSYRRPSEDQIKSLYANCRHRDRMDINSFRAVTKIAELNPDKVFCYTPLDEENSKSFTVGLKSNSSIESIILHYRPRGLCIDSSWRNKNENRAAMTNILAINEGFHFTPGASFISGSTNEATMERMLRTLSHEVVEHAKVLCDDIEKADHDKPEEREALLREAKLIVEQGFMPNIVNLDKDLAQFNAVRKVWPAARPRICQFHLLQAVRRRATDDGTKFPGSLGFTVAQDKALAAALREFQRVKDETEISDHKKHFYDDLLKLCIYPPKGPGDAEIPEWDFEVNEGDATYKTGMEKFKHLKAYFKKNWLTPQWIPYWTDLGLPAGQTRDNTNVNNFAESAFKVFDGVFLGHRKNKRVDRLVLQIMHMFNYYHAVRPDFKDTKAAINVDEAYIKLTLAAQSLWDNGLVSHQGGARYLIRLEIKDGKGGKKLKEYIVNVDQSQCSCSGFRQSGKLCSHLQAGRLYRFAGPPKHWQDQESLCDQGFRNLSARKARKQAETPSVSEPSTAVEEGEPQPRRETDAVNEKRVYAMIGHLADDAAQRMDEEDKLDRAVRFWENNQRGLRVAKAAALAAQDSDGEEALVNLAGTTRGRPRATSPLQPNRGKKRRRQASEGEGDVELSGNGSKVRFRDMPTRRRPGAPQPKAKATTSASTTKAGSSKSSSNARTSAATSKSTSGFPSDLAFKVETRWYSDIGGLGVADLDNFLDLCNILSAKLGRRILFMRTPGSELAKEVDALWFRTSGNTHASLEDTPMHLRSVHPSRQNAYDTVIFVHLFAKMQDFCLFEYSVKADRSEAIKAITPCNYQVGADVMRICRLGEFFRADRNEEIAETAYTSTGYTTRRLGLDKGKGAAGFWCIWLALCRLLGVTLHETQVRLAGIVGIKERLFRVYQSFLATPEGVPRWVLDDAMEGVGIEESVYQQPSGTTGRLVKLGPNDVVAVRERTYEATGRLARGLVREASLARFIDAFLNEMPKDVSMLDHSFTQADALGARRHGTLTPDLFKIAIHALRRSPSCVENKLYIASVETTGKMYNAPFTGKELLRPPRGHGSEEWFPDVDIFRQRLVVLPFSFVKKNSHYREFHVCVVNMEDGTISVLSPVHEQRMHSKMVERVQKMITYEKKARASATELEFNCIPSAARKFPAQASQPEDCAFIAFGYVSALVANPAVLPMKDVHPMRSHRIRAVRVSLLSHVAQLMADEFEHISWVPPEDVGAQAGGGSSAAPPEAERATSRAAIPQESANAESSQVHAASTSRSQDYPHAPSSSTGPSYSMGDSSPGPSTFEMELDGDPLLDLDDSLLGFESYPSPFSSLGTAFGMGPGDKLVAPAATPGIADSRTISPSPSRVFKARLSSSSAVLSNISENYSSPEPATFTTKFEATLDPRPDSPSPLSSKLVPSGSGTRHVAPSSAKAPASFSQATAEVARSSTQGADTPESVDVAFPEQVDQVTKDAAYKLISGKQPLEEVMRVRGPATGDGTVLTRTNFLRLIVPGRWVDDASINAWRALLKLDMDARGLSNKIYLMNTYFHTKLEDPYYNQSPKLSNWLPVDVFAADFEKLIVPVNQGKEHWIVVCIDFQRRRIDCYDSQLKNRSASEDGALLERFENFLSLHYRRMRREGKSVGVYDSAAWEEHLHVVQDFPQQVGDKDCGVFAAVVMQWLCLGGTPYGHFEQKRVDAFRMELARRFMNSSRRFQKSRAREDEPMEDLPLADAESSTGHHNRAASSKGASSTKKPSLKRPHLDEDDEDEVPDQAGSPPPAQQTKRPKREAATKARKGFTSMDETEDSESAGFTDGSDSEESQESDAAKPAPSTAKRPSRKPAARPKPAAKAKASKRNLPRGKAKPPTQRSPPDSPTRSDLPRSRVLSERAEVLDAVGEWPPKGPSSRRRRT